MPFEQKCKRFLDALYEGKNSSVFGVVKADHDAPLMEGMMAYTNYQLLNTLGLTREGIGKLLDIYNNDLKGLIDRLDALKKAAEDSTTFSGAADGVESSVKYIYETAAIEKADE